MSGRSLRHARWLVAVPALLIALAVTGAALIERGTALHAATAQAQAQQLLTAMLDQETGARGYFQTHDPTFLQPWYKGSGDFASAFAQARATDSGDAALERSLTQQQRVASSWHVQAALAIDGLMHNGVQPSTASALSRKYLMDSFRAANSSFAGMLENRRNSSLARATGMVALVAVVVSLTLAGVALRILQLVTRRDSRRRRRTAELRELLQVSESEPESRTLLIRHIERSIPGAHAAVLNRNNSDDRLEPALSPESTGGPLAELIDMQLQPRDCLAVRLSSPYARRHDDEPLAACTVCGRVPGDVACEPLLVGGAVIGSVLVASEKRMNQALLADVRESVVQAAPIIANQRNLALAERRAASDALTGLPNRRAADDTLKRMAAHAGRTLSPLSAVLVDLDHFKQINDVSGHERGDEVLAAVGQALEATLRASDFAARYGGEEFLVLLPDTARSEAALVAEKLRAAIAEIVVGQISVTASFGIAALPADASDIEQLLRRADRALYAAKHNGRNRVELAAPAPAAGGSAPGLAAEPPAG